MMSDLPVPPLPEPVPGDDPANPVLPDSGPSDGNDEEATDRVPGDH